MLLLSCRYYFLFVIFAGTGRALLTFTWTMSEKLSDKICSGFGLLRQKSSEEWKPPDIFVKETGTLQAHYVLWGANPESSPYEFILIHIQFPSVRLLIFFSVAVLVNRILRGERG